MYTMYVEPECDFTELLKDEISEYLATSGITGEEYGAPQEEIQV